MCVERRQKKKRIRRKSISFHLENDGDVFRRPPPAPVQFPYRYEDCDDAGMPSRSSPTRLKNACNANRMSMLTSRFSSSMRIGYSVSIYLPKTSVGKLITPSMTSTTTGRHAAMLRCWVSSSRCT